MEPEPIIDQPDDAAQPAEGRDPLQVEVDDLRSKLEAEGTAPMTAHATAATYVMVRQLHDAFTMLGSSPMGRSLMGKIGRRK
jgi:hypothetical protein